MKLDDMKQRYEEIPIPDDLDSFMEDAIHKSKARKRRISRGYKLLLGCLVVGYLVTLNTSPAFAKTMFKVPVVGEFSKILCVREYRSDDEVQTLDVKVPVVKNTGNKEMEDKVNAQISEHIDRTVDQLNKESQAIRKTMEKDKTSLTGKIRISIDYEITCNTKNLLSFQIITTYMANTSMQERQIFNLDPQTGKTITLKQLFGKDYKKLIDQEVKKQIKQTLKNDANATYFEGDMGFTGIDDNQHFYIDKEGNAVIVFEKYEIAPGYMGEQTFKIPSEVLKGYMKATSE